MLQCCQGSKEVVNHQRNGVMAFIQLVMNTLFLLVSCFIVILFGGLLRKLLDGRKTFREHPRIENPSCIVTLVHGTFARDTAWTLPDSLIVERLQEAALGVVQFERFRWSGWNSFIARDRASLKLVQYIEKVRHHYPWVPHYLIGHSHGGNVSIRASLALNGYPIAGLVCLATPVITTRRRRLTLSRQIMVGFGFFFVALLPFLDWASLASREPLTETPWAAILIAAIVAALWVPTASYLVRDITSGRSVSHLDPSRVAFIRAPFDEASGAIGTANLIGSVLEQMTSGPFDIMDRFERPGMIIPMVKFVIQCFLIALISTIVVAGAVNLPNMAFFSLVSQIVFVIGIVAFILSAALMLVALVAPLLRIARDNLLVMMLVILPFLFVGLAGGLLLLPGIVVGSIVLALAFGPEMLICAMFLEVTAEPCPAGQWTLQQLPVPSDDGLRHCSVYASDAGLGEIVSALAGMPGRHFRNSKIV